MCRRVSVGDHAAPRVADDIPFLQMQLFSEGIEVIDVLRHREILFRAFVESCSWCSSLLEEDPLQTGHGAAFHDALLIVAGESGPAGDQNDRLALAIDCVG